MIYYYYRARWPRRGFCMGSHVPHVIQTVQIPVFPDETYFLGRVLFSVTKTGDVRLDLLLDLSKQYCKFGGPSDQKKRDTRTDARTDEQTHTKNLRLSTQKPAKKNCKRLINIYEIWCNLVRQASTCSLVALCCRKIVGCQCLAFVKTLLHTVLQHDFAWKVGRLRIVVSPKVPCRSRRLLPEALTI